MDNPTIVPYKAEHALAIAYRDGDAREGIDTSLEKERGGPGFTAIYGGAPIGSAGITLMWPGVALAWTVLTDQLMARWPVWTTRHVRQCLRTWINTFQLHRVEAVVLADNVKNQKWLEGMGFAREGGVARAYTHDKRDVLRYEFIKPSIDIRIRKLRKDDEPAFRQLLQLCESKWVTSPYEWFTEQFNALVACHNDRPIGFTLYEYEYEETLKQVVCLGRNIGVHPDYRRFGVASRLHVARISSIRKQAIAEYLVLGSHGDNPLVDKLFLKYGATKTMKDGNDNIFVQKVS